MTLRKLGSPLEGHPNMTKLAGVEASTGSLGQGLSLGVGHALAGRIDKKDYHTYVMTGDGELGEGQVWEAAASAAKFGLDNLTAIVDRNHFQQTGAAEEVLNMDPIDGKFAAFGWHTQVINGNDMGEVVAALDARPGRQGAAHLHRLADAQGPGHPAPPGPGWATPTSTASRSRPSTWTRPSPRSPRAEPGDHRTGGKPA